MLLPVVGHVEIVGRGRKFARERVYLFYDREDFQFLAERAYLRLGRLLKGRELAVGKPFLLCLAHQLRVEPVSANALFERYDVLHFLQEPQVYVRKFRDFFWRNAVLERVRYRENAAGRRFADFFHIVRDVQISVPLRYKAVGADREHAERFLEHLLERATDGHDLADAFHFCSYLELSVLELVDVPAGHLEDEVVERRFEARGRRLRNGILELGKRVAERQFRGDESERVTGRFRGECRRAREAGIHLDDAVIACLRIERVLDVAFADDTQVSDSADGDFAKAMILLVRKRLRRCHNHGFARVYAHRVEIFHVADGDAVIRFVAHNLVFHLFPPREIFFNEDLRH